MAPPAGRLADAGYGTAGRAIAIVVAFAALVLADLGAHSVVLLGLAGVLLDVAVQGHQVFSQRDIYSLRPDARARVNTVFMTTVFAGGAAASAVAGWLHDSYGWTGVTLFGAALPVLGAIVWALGRRSATGTSAPSRR